MRRIFLVSLLLFLLLASCTLGGNTGTCSDGICVKIRSAGAIKKKTSIPMVIKVKTDKDLPETRITLSVYPGGIIEDAADKTDMVSKKNEGVAEIAWKKNMKAGEEITITQNIRFEEPGDYTVMTMIFGPNIDVRDLVVLRITNEGGMEFLANTPLPPSTQAPLITVTPGPSPTFLPTETLYSSPSTKIIEITSTALAYPAPEKAISTAEPLEKLISTPTVPAYP